MAIYLSVEQRAAYSFEEFVDTFVDTDLEATHQLGNVECITGVYAQWAMGTTINDDGDLEKFVLVSHPFNEKEATPVRGRYSWKEMTNKVRILEDILRQMCYTPLDEGWLSVGNWGNLDPQVQGKALRLTNRNFNGWRSGRVTGGSEFQTRESAELFLSTQGVKKAINQKGLAISNLRGPNFPTPGYDNGLAFNLHRMPDDQWEMDSQENTELSYIFDFEARKEYEITLDPIDNVLRNARGELVDIFGEDRGRYVMDCMGNIYLSTKADPSLDFLDHQQILGGAAVVAAGELYVEEGFITFAHNGSNAYPRNALALERFKSQFEDVQFEEPYEHPVLDYDQSWACYQFQLTPPLVNGGSDFFDPLQNAYFRKMRVPKTIPASSAIPAGSELKLTASVVANGEVSDQEVIYTVNANTPTFYTIFDPQPTKAGEELFFQSLAAQVTNVINPDIGEVQLKVDNCNPVCLPISEVQQQRVKFNGVETRYAYTFDEFLRNALNAFPDRQFDPPFNRSEVANVECVQGAYSRYVLGHSVVLEAEGENPWMMLITHPYSQEDAKQIGEFGQARLLDKAKDFGKTLEDMCYRPVDAGWVSIANWGLVDEDLISTALRFTNRNWGTSGRIVPGSERFESPSRTSRFLEHPDTKKTFEAVNISMSNVNGPNFPTPGYAAPVFPNLTPASTDSWIDNTSNTRIYIQESQVRQLFTANESLDGLLVNSSQRPIGAQDTKRFRYAMDCMGNIFHTNHKATNATVRFPSQFLGGGAVAAAGEFIVDNGNLRYMNTNAIHYAPPRSSLGSA